MHFCVQSSSNLTRLPVCFSLPRTAAHGSCRKTQRMKCKAVAPEISDRQFELDILDKNWEQEAWAFVLKNATEAPDGYWITDTVGEIPKEMTGTYFRNGPGEVESFGVEVRHAFDAQGHIGSVAIKDGKAFFRSRGVKTEESLLEEKAQRRLFRGVFGTTPKEGVSFRRLFKTRNAGNTAVCLYNGKLYSLYEGHLSSELDPFTLKTLYPYLPTSLITSTLARGICLVDSTIGPLLKLLRRGQSGNLDFRTMKTSAHPRRDPKRDFNVIHNYGLKFTLETRNTATSIKFYEFEDNLKILSQTSYTLENFSMIHDFIMTENYFVFFNSPCAFNTSAVLDPSYGIVNGIEWNEEGVSELHLVPRPSSNKNLKPRIIKMKNESSFVFHYVNAYEKEDQVVVDAVHYPRLESFRVTADAGRRFFEKTEESYSQKPTIHRTICDQNKIIEHREISQRAMEFPIINSEYTGQPYRYVYTASVLHPDAWWEAQVIAKTDMETGELKLWSRHRKYFVGEPLFVPKPNSKEEDDGWLVAFAYDGETRRNEFIILDAKKVEEGPITTLYLNTTFPHGLHGMWTSEYYGPK